MGIGFVLILVFYIAWKSVKSTVPFMNAGVFLVTSSLIFFPTLSGLAYYALPYIAPNQSSIFELCVNTFLFLLYWKEPLYGLPLGFGIVA